MTKFELKFELSTFIEEYLHKDLSNIIISYYIPMHLPSHYKGYKITYGVCLKNCIYSLWFDIKVSKTAKISKFFLAKEFSCNSQKHEIRTFAKKHDFVIYPGLFHYVCTHDKVVLDIIDAIDKAKGYGNIFH